MQKVKLSEAQKSEQAIIVALCRCALFNATDATKHQINRLRDFYLANDEVMANKINGLINPEPNEMDGLKIVQSTLGRTIEI